jgi:hypothetical protein
MGRVVLDIRGLIPFCDGVKDYGGIDHSCDQTAENDY